MVLVVRAQALNSGAGSNAGRPSRSSKPSLGKPATPRANPLNLNGTRFHKSFKFYSSGGGPNGPSGGGKSGGGGGGGDGGKGDGKGDEGEDGKKKTGFWKGWEDRVAFDPEFPFKVFLEQVIGVGACVIGDMSSRPNWGLNELDFVFSTVIVGSIMNFSLMYLLAPTAAAAGGAAAGGSLLQRALSEQTLRNWGAPGGNMFEPGPFSPSKRVLSFFYKSAVFSTIGMMAGLFGTSVSNGLLAVRQSLDPKFKLQNEPPNVVLNAFTWSMHMGFSSNLRYQVLGGLDRVLVGVMPPALFKLYSLAVRTTNNIVGGISFVTLARLIGSQKAAAPAPAPAAPAPAPAKGKGKGKGKK